MMYRDLPYYEGIRHCEYKLHKNKHKNHPKVLGNGPLGPSCNKLYLTLADSPFNGLYSHIQLT